ncbi:MAG TPA: SGNH/GDSL hydrolase family protein [Acidimicrobiales bacterium]|nr:SGNH/GDSL hydrolase family protein [Acidimicrobiales bacterium]
MSTGPNASRHSRAGRRRRLLAAQCAFVATAAVLVPGCSTSSDLPRVAVIGDSITALAQPDISTELEGSFDVGFVFRISVRMDQMLDLLAADLRDNGPTKAAVINLGTNDAIAGGDSAQALATFDQLMKTVGPVQCVVLTTIGPFADDRGRSDVGASLNRRMDHLVAADPRRFKLVDWSRLLGSLDPESRGFVLQPDRIHETEAGARWIAVSDKTALDTCGTDEQPSMIRVPGP